MNPTFALFVLGCATAALLVAYALVSVWRKQFKRNLGWLLLGTFHSAFFFVLWASSIDPGLRNLFVKTGESTKSMSFKPLVVCATSAILISLLVLWRKDRSSAISFLFGGVVTSPFLLLFVFLFTAITSLPAVRY